MAEHPLSLHAAVTLASINDAVAAIPEAIEAEAVKRTPGRPSGTTRTRRGGSTSLDVLIRAERLDQVTNARHGITQIGVSPAPIRSELLDAPAAAERAVSDAVWILASSLYVRGARSLVYGPGWESAEAGPYQGRDAWLTMAIAHAPLDTGLEVIGILDAADAQVRAALRVDRQRQAVPGNPPCPSCGVRILRTETAATDQTTWAVVCTAGCRCKGTTCPCRMATRVRGVRHIWPHHQIIDWVHLDATIRYAITRDARLTPAELAAKRSASRACQ